MPTTDNIFTKPTPSKDTTTGKKHPTVSKTPVTFNPTSKDVELEKRIESLEKKLNDLKQEHFKLSTDLNPDGIITHVDYDKEMQKHIRQLKTYNELKDLSMKLIQLIADQRQLTLQAIMNEMGIEDGE